MTYRPATAADIRFFAEHGWIVVEDVIDPDDLVELERRCDEIIANKETMAFDWAWDDTRGRDEREFKILQGSPSRRTGEFADAPFRTWAVEFGSALLGTPVEFWYDQFLAKPPQRSAATLWHQDEGYRGRALDEKGITCWMPFHDVDERNGCMHFIDRGHRDGVFDVFSTAELADIVRHCEELVERLARDRVGHRVQASGYVFDSDAQHETIIKWEGDTDIVHGIEPFAHLSPPLESWGYDPRLTQPMEDVIGHPEPTLFTEKLNLKRPRIGGQNPLHQDYPYWVDGADDATEIATTMIFLDDASLENGCLWVIPGSHRQGMWTTRTDGDSFAHNEVDTAAYPDARPVPLEVSAGATVTFGAFLVHQSAPNRSERERRALLYSYQPPGRRSQLEALRAYWSRRRS